MCRYATTILEDARLYSHHAKKKVVDQEDVKLSVSMQAEQNFTAPPTCPLLLELAHNKNIAQLGQPQNKHGLRLPPDRHCLTSCNYKLKADAEQGQGLAGGDGGHRIVMGGPQAIFTTEHMLNGLGQPAFNIQLHPSYGASSKDSKRKREENE